MSSHVWHGDCAARDLVSGVQVKWISSRGSSQLLVTLEHFRAVSANA